MIELKEDGKIMDEQRPWSNLPNDILELIASRLPLSSHPCYSLVCKRWWETSYHVYPAATCPLLMHFKKKLTGGDLCHYYSPLHHKTFTVKYPPGLNLSGTQFLCAKDGWLLLSRVVSKAETQIFLVNPFSASLHQIPSIKALMGFDGFAFSGSPTSADFMIMDIDSSFADSVEIALFRGGQWTDFQFYMHDVGVEFRFCYSNPVFFQGLFYCLGIKGNLGVFNPNDNTWSIVHPRHRLHFDRHRVFLIESHGELLSILIGEQGKPLLVYSFNQKENSWDQLKSLGDRMLFVGNPMSISMTAPSKAMGNKIYTHRFRGHPEVVQAQVKYSGGGIWFISKHILPFEARQSKMDSNKDNIFYTLGSCEDPVDEREEDFMYHYSIWIEPTFLEIQ